LLKDDGVIFISIDDNEVHHLRMIMDEIFGEENFRNSIVWAYRTGGAPQKNDVFAKKHDYLLFYSKSLIYSFNRLKEKNYYKKDFFGAKKDENGNFYAEVNLRDVIEGEIELLKDGKFYKKINVKPVLNLSAERVENFPSQKPIGLIKFLMEVVTNQDDIILDFFAGSGTTGHAVWDLNKEDGGNRKFILVQLDEEVLDEEIKKEFPTVADICLERLRRVSEKYKKENTPSLRDTPLQEGNSPSVKGCQAKPDRVVDFGF
jgi:adenine specific DNA methylase Mod